MSILVTGGTGFIGINIARLLAEQGRDVVVFDLSPLPEKGNVLAGVMDRVKMEIGSVTDLSQVLNVIKRNNVEGIIHCAAIMGNIPNKRPVEALQVNVIGTANILEAARFMNLKRVVAMSSRAVMGRPEDIVTPRKEDEYCLPLSGIYPASKICIEQLVYTYRDIYKLDVIAVRPCSVFGPGERTSGHNPDLLKILVMDAVAGKPIHYKTAGDFSDDVTYIKDFAKGAVQAYDCKAPTYYLYNLSYGKNTKMSEVCDVLKGLFPDVPIEMGPGPWDDPTARQRAPQDITRAREDFGYEPEWPVERAIPDWVRWLKEGKY
ncbi:NAD-dependent epimerase/dehydratase family protein [Chloroflexota bacterium]